MNQQQPWRRWATIFRRDPRQEIDSELAFHVEARVQEYIDRGMSPEAARRAATERLGDSPAIFHAKLTEFLNQPG